MKRRSKAFIASLAVPISMFLAGCGGAEPSVSETERGHLAPPLAGRGVQFKMVTKLEPGTESEICQFLKAPAGGLLIKRDEVRYTEGSHHVLLYETSYDEIPTQRLDGTPVETTGLFDCTDGVVTNWRVTRLIAGSQNFDGSTFIDFPEGVAMTVRPGAVLLMNAHYINAAPTVLEPEVRINIHTAPEETVHTEGDTLFLYKPLIHVAPHSTGRARMRCPVHEDITISKAQSHMHARGVGFSASLVGEAAPFYTTTQWENVPSRSFPDGLKLSAGQWIDYACDYSNKEARDVYQGPRSTDEMCMLVGSFYPANYAISNCLEETFDPAAAGYFIAAEWVGNGEATCAESLSCLQERLLMGFNGMIPCVTGSNETVSKEISAVVRCMYKNAAKQRYPFTGCDAELAACNAR